MGFGDFVKGVGGAITPDIVGDTAKTVGNVAKGAAYVANPTHLDDIAKGGIKAAQFVAEHPGQTLSIAKTVATEVGKDMLDPKQLALTAGLALATGGTGVVAGALAKGALAAKSTATGIKVAKGLDTATDIARGLKTGAKVVDKVGDAGKTLSRTERVAKTVLGEKPGLLGKVLNPLENASGTGKLGKLGNFTVGAQREAKAQKFLSAGGEAPSMLRQVGAAAIQGSGRGTGMTRQLAGMSDEVYDVQKAAWKGQAVANRMRQGQMAQTGVEIGANPMGYAAKQATKQATNQINQSGHSAGYTDRGSTVNSLYGNGSSQTTAPSSSTQTAVGSSPSMAKASLYSSPGALTQPGTGVASTSQVGNMYRPRSEEFQTGTQAATPGGGGGSFGPPKTPPPLGFGGQSAGGEPAGGNNWSQPQYPSATLPSIPGAGSNAPEQQTESRTTRGGGGGAQTHLWMGPRSQALGGIHSNYDWRSLDPLRPISVAGRVYNSTDPYTSGQWQQASGGQAANQVGQSRTQRRGSNANAMGVPGNFSPEVGKDGNSAVSQGQTTADTALPVTLLGSGTPDDPTQYDMRDPVQKAAALKLLGKGGSNVRSGGSGSG